MKKVTIYTDGACSGNPGTGGYAGILIYNGVEKIVSGKVENTTNNRMELLSVIKSLSCLKEKCEVELYTDSAYVADAFNQNWIEKWKNSSWKNANNKPVKNVDLWEELLTLTSYHIVTFIKVKGHADNEYNNRCDKIAVNEYKNIN